jgi:DNA-binding HxlR family transcriptional regulator
MSAAFELDLNLTRDALSSSTLNHGLLQIGDRWTLAVLLGAFIGIRRFDSWLESMQIPRRTLSDRLKSLVALGVLKKKQYQTGPSRFEYQLTESGLTLYDAVLMIWSWEKRWGTREFGLPTTLVHKRCGQPFVPQLACRACNQKTGINDLSFSLGVNQTLLARARPNERGMRVATNLATPMGLGLKIDHWTLMIVSAVVLGCHYFDQLIKVLGVASAVLTRRLVGMIESGLLIAQTDLKDGRRVVYRLTPASRDLFGYLVCFARWASEVLLNEPSSIRPTHKLCGHGFAAQVACSNCGERVLPRDVSFSPAVTATAENQ